MSRALILAALMALPALAGCLSDDTAEPASVTTEAPPALVDDDGFAPVLVSGAPLYSTLQVATSTASVHMEIYLPDASKAVAGAVVPDTFPTVLLASPYNGAGYGPNPEIGYGPYDFLIKALLPRGYAIVIGDSAAMGGSEGCWDFMGPHDVAAATLLVEAIAAESWSNGKVGMMGLSYDAMTQIMAASQMPKALTTIVPAAALTNAYAGLYMGGVHYGGGWWQTTAGYTSSALTPPGTTMGRYPGYVGSVADAPTCIAETNAMGNDPTGTYNAFYKARDFRASASEVNASVFQIQGFLDAAVKPDNAWPWFNDVQTAKKAWYGQWFHQYPTASVSGREDMYLTIHRWFDHELKGIPNGIMDEPTVDVQDSLGRWRHEATWPPADATPSMFMLSGTDALVTTDPADGMRAFGGAMGVAERVGQAGGAARFTVALNETLHIAGIPTMALSVRSDRATGQVLVNVYDEYDGERRLVTRGARNLALPDDLSAARPLTPGAWVDVNFPLYPADYVLLPGHTLAVELRTQDASNWFHADGTLAGLTVRAGKDIASSLTLPVISRADDAAFLVACGAPIKAFVPECVPEKVEDKGATA